LSNKILETTFMKPATEKTRQTNKDDRLYVRVSHEIKQLLCAREFKEGDRLPSETELSKLLGVSRTTIREAIVALEVSGVLAVKRNVGAVVLNLSEELPSQVINSEAGPFEQIQVRLLLEPEAARLAAIHRTVAQCDRMEEAIEMMVGENQAGFESEEGDMQFHLMVAKASKNSLLASHIESLWEMRHHGKLWPQLQQSVDLNTMRTRAVFEHMQILERIRSQQPEEAQQTMLKHLASVHDELESTIRE
jgi:DNA-binding FadR family transcriptional regulator